ncbi:family 43 glycosylhydrolase [Aestuariibaculum suncheonense]|uniref:Family 43 glycosylhydrolase n=1 Tax=Aestuariibaculum suncheonense TaxID=1028745 RepID=A0A8J6UJV3_9FLAO|nr:family 43 glycosylhydrolase [Aestuariibaculum suncheonense]MBD0835111.1 family 43 glycosylhydrolase [Aestuariibaculum suncheonense]
MYRSNNPFSVFIWSVFLLSSHAFAQNPIIRNQFTADPSARVFGDRIYIFPSHDILAEEGKGRIGWFCMEDYHVFSSENLTDWMDHGTIIQQTKVDWVNPDSYSMWAPDCIEKNGKYYFYFPSTPNKTITEDKGFCIGVAISDKPEGPYVPESKPIKGVRGIDPNVFIDHDGQAYLYWSQGHIYAARLKDNMLELDSEVKILEDLPTKGLKEGPFVFERHGIYYLTYPHVAEKTERLEYAISDNPLGPFKFKGVIMDESPTGCWTNHHSIIQFKNQWYLFYHHNDYSPDFDKARSVRADTLHFNADGTIQKVKPTLRGIGISDATKEIQIDRYSRLDSFGASTAFLDSLNTFKGWRLKLNKPEAWVQYNTVDFGSKLLKSVVLKVKSSTGGTLEVRSKGINGMLLSRVIVPESDNWKEIKAPLVKSESNIENLFIQLKSNSEIEIDWVRFE